MSISRRSSCLLANGESFDGLYPREGFAGCGPRARPSFSSATSSTMWRRSPSRSPVGDVLMSLLAPAAIGCILAGLAVSPGINQFVTGIAINIMVLGRTSHLVRLILGADANSTLLALIPLVIPVRPAIPSSGPVLFNQDPITYLTYLAVPLTYWFLCRTPWGQIVRAIGDYSIAADTAELCVVAKLRSRRLLSGALPIVRLQREHERGQGWIALAAHTFVFAGCIFFAFSASLQLRLQFKKLNVPYHLLSMVPFVAQRPSASSTSGAANSRLYFFTQQKWNDHGQQFV